LVTAVGRDLEGREILERMDRWGMDTSGVQAHPDRPTGRVTAHLAEGEPRYEIEPAQAYDDVKVERLPPFPTLAEASLLYHGTLALREEGSAEALSYLRRRLDIRVLVDVNLRAPWWDRALTLHRVRGSDWLKVNREEAGLLGGGPVSTEGELKSTAESLRDEVEVGTLVVTLGSGGVLGLDERGTARCGAPDLGEIVDTVGAGDAFSAVLLVGMHRGWPMDLLLRRAADFAAELCQVRGAIPSDPGLYARYLRRWEDAA
jgi:fructokinase